MTLIPVPLGAGAVEEAKKLIEKLVGPACEEAGAIISERIRLVRFHRQLKSLRAAVKIVEDAGLKPKALKMNVLFPLLDAAALEDDPVMEERWASLLASAADPNNSLNLEASFTEILKQLAPAHAFLLDVFYERVKHDRLPPEEWSERGYHKTCLRDFLQKEVPQFEVAVENLLRLKLITLPTAKLGVANGNDVHIQVTSTDLLCPTHLGNAFVSACAHGRSARSTGYGVTRDSISNYYWTQGGSMRLWSPEEEAAWKRRQKPNR